MNALYLSITFVIKQQQNKAKNLQRLAKIKLSEQSCVEGSGSKNKNNVPPFYACKQIVASKLWTLHTVTWPQASHWLKEFDVTAVALKQVCPLAIEARSLLRAWRGQGKFILKQKFIFQLIY